MFEKLSLLIDNRVLVGQGNPENMEFSKIIFQTQKTFQFNCAYGKSRNLFNWFFSVSNKARNTMM